MKTSECFQRVNNSSMPMQIVNNRCSCYLKHYCLSCVLLWEVSTFRLLPEQYFKRCAYTNDIILLLTFKKIINPSFPNPHSYLYLKGRMLSQLSACTGTESAQTLGSGFWVLRNGLTWCLPVDTLQKVQFLSSYLSLVRGFTLFPMAQEYI